MNPLTSTIIDDESLLDQLRMYGETNLPLLPGQATSTQKSTRGRKAKLTYLNDSNRDIYLKKLNHYKAREKVETNPSRGYLKTQPDRKSIDIKRISNIYKLNEDFEEDDDVIECNDDVIELDKTEYVQVVNGATSPLSMSDYDPNTSKLNEDDDYGPSILSSTRAPSLGNQNPIRSPMNSQQVKTPEDIKASRGYVKLKDRIELDQTLSKYRMDIENILHNSVRRNRLNEGGSAASRYLNDEVLDNYKKSSNSQKIMYFPKTEPVEPANSGILGSLKNRIFNNSEKTTGLLENREGLRKREVIHNKNEKPNLPLPNKEPKLSFFSFITNFISSAGMQLANFLPYLVLIVLTVVALQYVHLKLNNGDLVSSAQDDKISDATVTPRVKESDLDAEGFYCSDIKDTKCSGTKILIKELIDYLRTRSGQVDCAADRNSYNKESTTKSVQSIHFSDKCVHLNEIIDYLVSKRQLIANPEVNQDKAINSVLTAISKNPHWDILLLNEAYEEINDYNQITYLISLVSSKSFMCRFKELLYFIYVRALIFGMGVVAIVLAYLVFLAYRKNKAIKDKQYFDLITRVTGMVEKQYELSLLDPANIKPYIAISHIYDTLFDPSERANKKKLWNKIVNFIQDHESRIHLETQFINGEETHVWKWIVAKHESVLKNKYKDTGIGLASSTMINPETNNFQSNSKPMNQMGQMPLTQDRVEPVHTNGWQGSAFNRSEKLNYSPTPCLKIRNMFDLEEFENNRKLPFKIHNDILEKCMINNMNKTILHIACDKKSREGCVYVKCASNDGAGKAYEALNGTWYNGKLLNVKFLRSDRYLERFPESINFNQPLKPVKI